MNSTTAQFLELLKRGIWGTCIDTEVFEGDIDWNRMQAFNTRLLYQKLIQFRFVAYIIKKFSYTNND